MIKREKLYINRKARNTRHILTNSRVKPERDFLKHVRHVSKTTEHKKV